MSKNLEIAKMVFLFALLVILYGWSENGRYQANVSSGGTVLIDTRSGNHWLLQSNKMLLPPAKMR